MRLDVVRRQLGEGSARRGHGARGAGIISATFGLLMFLIFLLFAIQILYSLYATSVVSSAAYDAGRHVARTGDAGGGTARFNGLIGSYPASVSFSTEGGSSFADAEVIVVTVTGQNPTLLPDRFAQDLPFATVEKTIRIRNERFIDE